jgi:NAD(P)-dependent dehydrogenase (short-subunit alcohol dehydrogenase family)
MNLNLGGKNVLITGGSKGLGLACAFAFAREGARVAIASRSQANLDAAKAGLDAEDFDVRAYAADLTRAEEAARLVDTVERELGPIDILVNSAGAAKRHPPEEMDVAAWQGGLNAKFYPYIYTQGEVLKRMAARADAAGQTAKSPEAPKKQIGAIVNLVGVGGKVPSYSHMAGGAANAALMITTIGLAQHYARRGIRINAINPGHTLTGRIEQALVIDAKTHNITREEALARAQAHIPLGRYGRPEEIADAALFLASERAGYIIGAVLQIDGGNQPAM